MKRYIKTAKDPDTNPSDRAEAILQSLGASITQLHNLHSKALKLYKEHGSDDAVMSQLADHYGDLLKEIDQLYDKYKNFNSK